VMLVLLSGCGSEYVFRYRLTVEVEIDGEVKSGSSIIQVTYYGGGGKSQPYQFYTDTKGVAPVVDLGGHGWLVAAMSRNVDEEFRREKKYGLTCKSPKSATDLPDAFELAAPNLVKLRKGKKNLVDGGYPTFIWFPPDKPYTYAQQLCPEEFIRSMAVDIKLRSVTIEIAPDAPVSKRVEITARWLDEIRENQRDGYSARSGIYKPSIYAIEKNY
jgi:hypothetical protein